MMKSTAWDAAKSTQVIAELEYETVEVLTRMYQSQAITLDYLNKVSKVYFDQSVIMSEADF